MTAIEFYSKLTNLERSLTKFAFRLTMKKTDAKDLVQETFLKVLMNKDKFVNNENFKAWAFTIMKNSFINDYRRAFRQNTYCDQTQESFFINQTESSYGYDPDSTYLAMEITQKIEAMKDIFRIPLKMHINGYKYKEIADELNLKIGTVKSRIFLSRKQLKAQLSM